MKKYLCAIPLAFVLCLTSIFAKEWSTEQKDVLASLNKYFSAVRQGNQKEIVSFWHPKFVGWDYAQALPANCEAHLKVIEAIGKSFKFKKLEFNPLEIQVEGNIAIIHGNYDVIIQDSAGKGTPTSGLETITLVKKDNKWAMIGLVSVAKESPEEANARGQQLSAEVRKVIEAYNSDLVRYYASGDIESVMSVFAEDARQMASNNPALEGREKIRAFWKQAFSWGRWDFTLTTASVVANGPLAVELGKYQLQFTPGPSAPSGMNAFTDTGDYVCYWRLDDDGKWRIVYDIATTDQPVR